MEAGHVRLLDGRCFCGGVCNEPWPDARFLTSTNTAGERI